MTRTPMADAADWPDPPASSSVAEAFAATTERLRRVLALRRQLGDPGPPPTIELGSDTVVDDPTMATFRLVALAPLVDLDRQSLLGAPSVEARLTALDELLVDEEAVARARLAAS